LFSTATNACNNTSLNPQKSKQEIDRHRHRHRQRKREKKKETDAQHSSHASPLDYKSAKHFPHNYEITDLQNLTRTTENTHTQSNYNTKCTQNLQQVPGDRATTK
jgi:hypothetical protein